MIKSEKAVSEVMGMVMVLSIMVVVIGSIMVVGIPMIQASKDRGKMDVAANTFLSLQNDIEEVVRGPIWVRDPSNITLINGTGPSRETEFELMGGTLSVFPNTRGITYQIASYTKDSSIESSAPAIRLKRIGIPDDPGYAQQWSLQKIAWGQAYGNISINGSAKIAILDTGVDAAHPDLAGRMIAGKSFVNGDPNTDPNGHGTALAGIAAAEVNNSVGMAGVSYANTGIMSVQVLQPNGTGYDKDVVKGVLWAADNGANVILMGFSSPDYSTSLDDAIKYAWRKGVVVVAATGNGGLTAPSYPAGMANVIGVAATDENDNLASISNTGSASVAAPGVDIYTTLSGGGYGSVGGTSAASAHVAGLAALLAANRSSNGDIYSQILGATDSVAGMPFGRINVTKTLGKRVIPLPTATIASAPTPRVTLAYIAAATTISLMPTSGLPATSVSVSGSGFHSGDAITIKFNGVIQTTSTSPCTVRSNSFTCSFNIPATTPGSYTVVASDTNSNTATATFIVKSSTTTNISLSSGTNPSTYGDSLTFTATVTSSGGSIPDGEIVTFKDGGTTLGTGTTSSGSATFSISTLSAGNHSITAVYAGDTNFATSTSLPLSQTVNQASTTTAVNSSVNPSTYGQSVTFTATISSSTATGTVQFMIDGSNFGSPVPVSGGIATIAISTLSVGSHDVTAVYSGDSNYTGSSGTLSSVQIVTMASTTTSVSSSSNPSVLNQSVTFTATILPSAATGMVQFTIDGTNFSFVNVLGGIATIATSNLSVGNHTIIAVYYGDSNCSGSTSTLYQIVNNASTANTTTTSVSSSSNPSILNQSITFTATISSSTATGTVQFMIDGSNFSSPVTISGGSATSSAISTLSVGSHTITAIYSGDSNYSGSTGTLSQTVNSPSSTGNYTISISSGNITYTAGQESIIYENGAVIRKYESGDALMISDPLINIYNKGDGNIVVSIHSISINGTSSSVGGDGKAWVETRLESYNQTTPDLVISNQQTSINILTIYPQAWKAFFDKKLDEANLPTTDYSDSISTASITVTIRRPVIFSLYESKLDIKVR